MSSRIRGCQEAEAAAQEEDHEAAALVEAQEEWLAWKANDMPRAEKTEFGILIPHSFHFMSFPV